jgi:peptidoglycan/LPS O-acetylase OafA/YrhL
MALRHTANNFDFIRLAAATMVLCSHQFALLFRPEPHPFGLFTLGTLGVLIFFSVSGYLVAQSWDSDPHVWRFAARRFLRIWPGLAVVVLFAVLCVGPLFSQLPISDYFQTAKTWRYLWLLCLRVQLYLPEVFKNNPWNVVNGSLWTIPVEVKWYGILLAAGICGLLRWRTRVLMLAMVVLYATYIYGVFDVQHNPLANYPLPAFGCEYGTFFCYGVLLHRWRHVWEKSVVPVLACLALLAGILVAMDHQYAAVFVLLPFVVIWFGSLSTPLVREAGRYGDLSYGIYIYAYMVQQAVIAVIGFHHSYVVSLSVSMAVTLTCAFASWRLIERPALNLKRHLRVRSSSGDGGSEKGDVLAMAQ